MTKLDYKEKDLVRKIFIFSFPFIFIILAWMARKTYIKLGYDNPTKDTAQCAVLNQENCKNDISGNGN